MKNLFVMVIGALLGVFGTLFTLHWQEEALLYRLSETAQFGNVVYQNLSIVNTGWNPAENVKIVINRKEIGPDTVKASVPVSMSFANSIFMGTVDRVRRGEAIMLSFAFFGKPLVSSDITIKSDRSIANFTEPGEENWFDWASFFVGIGAWFLLIIIPAITIPAYKDYQKRARAARSKDE